MNLKIADILNEALSRNSVQAPDLPTIDLIADRKIPLNEANKIELLFKTISEELEMEIKVVGGGYGCTKLTITAIAKSEEEVKRLLEELFSSELFAKKAVEVGFDMLVRYEPYLHKTLSNGRLLGKPQNTGIPVFLSYSKDDDIYRDELEAHLSALSRQNLISVWHDGKFDPGEKWETRIKKELENTKLFLFLISSDFLSSDYCMDIEVPFAIDRQLNGTANIAPILVRPSDWEDTTLSQFQILPDKAKPITKWENRDEAWTVVAKGIRRLVREMRQAS